jgi:hypothetical protein
MQLTLSPAYGRDYRSIKAVKDDFNANKDFIIETFLDPYCGKPCNKSDLKRSGHKSVMIRYQKMTKVTQIKI